MAKEEREGAFGRRWTRANRINRKEYKARVKEYQLPFLNALDVKWTTFLAIIFCFGVFFSGCHLENAEQKGDAEARAGRFESAIYWYESALGTEDRSTIHWKMAEIFTNRLHDPASAAYHYRRILALHGSGARADASRAALRRLEAGSAPAEGGQTHSKSGPTPKPVAPEQAAVEGEKAAKGKVRTYVVQSGDTLVSISKKFYQTPARWKDVLDANQNQLSNPDELKAGQTIILP
ncbi:MAG: LysM peptidoglycan-binding domain-containing protein [Verrucomicrobia bacterium]|nr:LysM peptidoglycan-binding domain-containing protein [Verrucomicrobiota bacterium]